MSYDERCYMSLFQQAHHPHLPTVEAVEHSGLTAVCDQYLRKNLDRDPLAICHRWI